MIKTRRIAIVECLLIAAVLLTSLPVARAQVASGAFTGVVTDQTGAIIPGAVVRITNEATNVTVNQNANSSGLYTASNLNPGFYTLQATSTGFKTMVNTHVQLSVGYTQRVDFKLEVGAVREEVTVSGEAPLVDTESNRMSELVTSTQVQNMPLNGRNIFQLIQLAPGAVNTTNLVTEPGNRGFTTVVNGARVNMNGYQIDGISDKGLSGGSNTQPSVDSVQEFRVDTEQLSAEYGSVVGSITQIATKSGGNQFHGDVYEYDRNDALDARNFFETNKLDANGNEIPGSAKNPFHMNQFGATLGGPIKKDRLFFFGSYEGERTRIFTPELEQIETPQFSALVQSAAPNSVAALLYKNFPGPAPTTGITSLSDYVTGTSGFCGTFDASCIQSYGLDPTTGLGAALLANPDLPTFGQVNAASRSETFNQFYNGNQFSGRIDYQGDKDKVFGSYFFDRYADPLYSPAATGGVAAALVGIRGFHSPTHYDYPHFSLGWTRSLSPTVVNDMRLGWNRNVTDIGSNTSGVPQITIDTGEVEFGNYSGYPQLFHEEVFQYSDIVSVTHGKHQLKFGGSVQRNYENSEFNVGRPSYEFYDSVSLAAGFVEGEAAGVDPGGIDPTTGYSTGQAHLSSNIRAWRNWEFGGFINDNWKITPRLSLTLGLRYDLYTRHTEKYGQTTVFGLGTGDSLTEQLRSVNCYTNISGATGDNGQSCVGGFQQTKGALATGDHNNFGPRVGFAWDVMGDSKTSLRGGFGVSYNGEVYNALSNSRWDPPLYSFNVSGCSTGINNPGPTNNDTCIFGPVAGAAPTYTGAPSSLGSGPAGATGSAFAGNIMGWNPWNANLAQLTGLVLKDFRDPYVYSSQLSLEHQFSGGFVVKTAWVGTFGHKLYRSENINRLFDGSDLQSGSGPGPCVLVNCLYGRLRTWENSVNSNYNGLQIDVEKRLSNNLEVHTNYVWSHSLDTRSTWHSGSTTSNGAAEGFSMDQAKPGLDYSSSIFDVRHAFSLSAVYHLPWYSSQKGLVGHVLGGWEANTIISVHSGFPWTPFCSNSSTRSSACDFNRDTTANDRPNAPSFGSTNHSTSNAAFEADHPTINLVAGDFFCGANSVTNAGCTPATSAGNAFNGNLGRNTFRGPNWRQVDFSLFKDIKAGERFSFQFRAEAFNIFNRTNLWQPNATFGQAAAVFGLSQSAFFPRQIQFGLKMLF